MIAVITLLPGTIDTAKWYGEPHDIEMRAKAQDTTGKLSAAGIVTNIRIK